MLQLTEVHVDLIGRHHHYHKRHLLSQNEGIKHEISQVDTIGHIVERVGSFQCLVNWVSHHG